MKCPICNKEIGTIDEIIKHLEYSHFLNYKDFIENEVIFNKRGTSPPTCYSCGDKRTPLTWLDRDFYYLPCRNCIKRKSDLIESKEEIIKNIKSFYKKATSDRHFQLFILDDIYIHRSFPHCFDTFEQTLKLLTLPKDRDDLWFLDWKIGYPKLLCPENINGIKLVSLTNYFKKFINEDDKIIVGNYEIRFPEKMPYDNKHQSRYNILNKENDARRVKRLKLPTVSEDTCIKFYATGDDWNSIFKLYKDGVEINPNTISHLDSLIIKLAILRNKQCMKLIQDILYELLRDIGYFKDSIILKNNILLDPNKDKTLNLSWFYDNSKLNKKIVNISIL